MKRNWINAIPVVLSVLLLASAASALEMDRLKVQRKEVFEFTERPKVTCEGDKVTIAFSSKGFCDATVAIEDAEGRIIRHLASGVIGDNAPPTFRSKSLKQTVVWDGKNDKGEYVDDKNSLAARVSLGLKAYFARSFVPEIERCAVGVLDSNGNLLFRVGQYGNIDSDGPGSRAPLDGDGVGLFYPAFVATHTDRRLFISDLGNARIVGVKLEYHATERVPLKDVLDGRPSN